MGTRKVGTEASFATLVRDASTQSQRTQTAVAYVNALKRLFVVEEQPT
ncbi:hypothetical protein [Actinomyces lilanjuaniae]|nr:hypothetical protein [Actinomyces lilanjuaniae]